MALTVDSNGDWKRVESELEKEYKFCVQYAVSSRARCRKCCEVIPKGEVRVGAPIRWSSGPNGFINSWHHAICIRATPEEQVDCDKDIFGFEQLTMEDQNLVRTELAKTTPPQHIKTLDPNDESFAKAVKVVRIAPPSTIILPLLPYQEEGYGWMKNQERGCYRGGVLADEMGMGKTIQAISLIAGAKLDALSPPVVSTPVPAKPVQTRSKAAKTQPKTNKRKKGKDAKSKTTKRRRKTQAKSAKKGKKNADSGSNSDDNSDADDDDNKSNDSNQSASSESDQADDDDDADAATAGTKVDLEPPTHGPTLVVCPPSAMLQWADEIARCTSEGALSVLVFYQNRTALTVEEVSKYDVVLTTYHVLEYEYRKVTNKSKVPCQYCGKKFLPRSLMWHNKYFCGPEAERTAKQKKQERKRSTTKAMRTLKIINGNDDDDEDDHIQISDDDDDNDNDGNVESTPSRPAKRLRAAKRHTPMAIYKDLMAEANRIAIDMYQKAPPMQLGNTTTMTVTTTGTAEAPASLSLVVTTPPPRSSTTAKSSDALTMVISPTPKKFVAAPKKQTKPPPKRGKAKSTKKVSTSDEEDVAVLTADSSSEDEIVILDDSDSDDAGTVQNPRRSSRATKQCKPWQDKASDKDIKDALKDALGDAILSISSDSSSSSSSAEDETAKMTSKPKLDTQLQAQVIVEPVPREFAVSAPPSSSTESTPPAQPAVSSTETRATRSQTRAAASTNSAQAKGSAAPKDISATTNDSSSKIANDSSSKIANDTDTTTKISTPTGIVDPSSSEDSLLATSTKKAAKPKRNVTFNLPNSSSDESFCASPKASKAGSKTAKAKATKTNAKATKPSAKAKAKAKCCDSDDSDCATPPPATRSNKRKTPECSAMHKKKPECSVTHKAKQVTSSGSSDSDSCDASAPSKKAAANKKSTPTKKKVATRTATPKKAPTQKKCAVADSSSSDSSSSDDELISRSRQSTPNKSKSQKPVEETRYADPGEVVDGDGIDLGQSLVHCVKWHRIILDEAHKIKSRTNSTAKSVFALNAKKRWCLTGTPLQNRVGELFALIRFLQVDPYAYYFCSTKDCNCKSLSYNFGVASRYCEGCQHTKLKHYSYFNKYVINPIKRYGNVGDGRLAMIRLRSELLGQIMLRRTKAEKAADVKLPELKIEVRMLTLDSEERDFYECIYKQTRSRFDKYVVKGTLLHNYAHVFELLSRLRQAVDHPFLVVHGSYKGQELSLPSHSTAPRVGGTDVCAICSLNILSMRDCAVSTCRHTFHRECVMEYIGVEDNNGGEDDDDDDGAEKAKASKKRKRGAQPQNALAKQIEQEASKFFCPECYLPLSITLDLRGLDDEDDDAKSKQADNEASTSEIPNADLSSTTTSTPVSANAQATTACCVVCMDNPRDALLLPCGHMYTCMSCVSQLNQRVCPVCRTNIQKVIRADSSAARTGNTNSNNVVQATPENLVKSASMASSSQDEAASVASTPLPATAKVQPNLVLGRRTILQKIDLGTFSSSTKIEAVAKEIVAMKEGEKAIIFSQYTPMIDLVEWRLKKEEMVVVKLMGYMPMTQRRSVLSKFKTSPEVRVLLMSLKAGGEGLNLQEATHVFVLEPWWNPQVEMQAIQRAHRIGQKHEVKAVRFITQGTVEERMLELQQKKQLIFDGAVDAKAQAIAQLTAEDLQFLFGSG